MGRIILSRLQDAIPHEAVVQKEGRKKAPQSGAFMPS